MQFSKPTLHFLVNAEPFHDINSQHELRISQMCKNTALRISIRRNWKEAKCPKQRMIK
jgi:hypothetical protein